MRSGSREERVQTQIREIDIDGVRLQQPDAGGLLERSSCGANR